MCMNRLQQLTERTIAVAATSLAALILMFAFGTHANAQTDKEQLFFRATRGNVDVRGSSVERNCVALYRDGQYLFEAQNKGLGPVTQVGRVVEGRVTDSELQEMVALVDSKEFRDLGNSPSESGQARYHLEMLAVEIQRDSGLQHVHFVDYDGKSSFTPTAKRLSDWMRKMQKNTGNPVKGAKQTICLTPPVN